MKRWLWLPAVLTVVMLLLILNSSPAAEPALAVVPHRMIALTFDDGPDPAYTLPILQILRERGLHATFFLIGRNALAYPDIVRQIAREGHLIANHTLTHPQLQDLSEQQVRAELEGFTAVMTSILGPDARLSPYFRPPRGKESTAITQAVDLLKLQTVLWNVCVENHATSAPQDVFARVTQLVEARNGGILLAHDGELDRTLTVRSLPLLLDGLLAKGYRVVPLDEYLDASQAAADY